MTLQEGMLKFTFSEAKNVFRFDEENRSLPNFHGLSHCMKAVDYIVEYSDHYLFVEIKDPQDPTRYHAEKDINTLINDLVVKFRDTFLYRWAEGKLNKPVYYQCLIELDNAQILHIMNKLRIKLPMERQPSRWLKPLAKRCSVANVEKWNREFPNMQITRVKEAIP